MATMKEKNGEGEITVRFDGKIDGVAVKINYAITLPEVIKPNVVDKLIAAPISDSVSKTADSPIISQNKIICAACNESFVAIAYDNNIIRIFDKKTKKIISDIGHQKPNLKFMSFSQKNEQLICCFVGITNDIIIYDINNGSVIVDLKNKYVVINGAITSFYVSPLGDGEIILGTSTGEFSILTQKLQLLIQQTKTNKMPILYASFHNNMTTLLQENNIERRRHHPLEKDIISTITYNNVSCITTSLDQKMIVSTTDGWIRIYQSGSQLIQDPTGKNVFQSVVITPDDTRIITLDDNRNIKVWNIETGTLERDTHLPKFITLIVATPDSNLILIYSDSDVALFNITNDAITFY